MVSNEDKDHANGNWTLWIIGTQIFRRNLNLYQLSYYRGMHYNAVIRIRGGDQKSAEQKSKGQNDPLIETTSTSLAGQYVG